MLRRSKPSSGASTKRHSMIIDMKPYMLNNGRDGGEEVSRYMYQTMNRSQDSLNFDVNAFSSSAVPTRPRVPRRSRIKRSSVMLDSALVRDYNIVMSHFEKQTIGKDAGILSSPSSNNSLSSTDSGVSSLFSLESTTSIRDYLYDSDTVGVETCDKILFNIADDQLTRKDLGDSDIYRLDLPDGYYRTSLEFD